MSPYPLSELHSFKYARNGRSKDMWLPVYRQPTFLNSTVSWVGGAQRIVEAYNMPRGILLKVEGGGEFFIPPDGETIGKSNPPKDELNQLDREIILGPVLVLALALRGAWSLHASAAVFRENVIVFLGESGWGKSTLAAYLSQIAGWRLVADDILPVDIDANTVNALPHFPQLKLPPDAQPGPGLPEKLPLAKVCLLTPTEGDPELQMLPTNQAVQVLLSHTAGTRLFTPELLSKHLDFCAHAAGFLNVYRLAYPKRGEALPVVRKLLEGIC